MVRFPIYYFPGPYLYIDLMKKYGYSFEEHLKEQLKDPEFKKAWDEIEIESSIAEGIIGKRIEKNISQRDLAKKINSTQAVISRIESMNANPSINTLKRIAKALDAKLEIKIR